jgi:two-component system, cell cycle response regulator
LVDSYIVDAHRQPDAGPARWTPRVLLHAIGLERWRSVVGPALFASIAIVLLVYNHTQQRVNDIVFWLSLILIAAVVAWMIETSREQWGAIARHRQSAFSDQATGLLNRRRLEADLEAAMGTPGYRNVLVLIELDGLQGYTDRLGYAAGDRLLQRVAHQLVNAVAPLEGTAYRIDANRFAVLVPAGGQQFGEILIAAMASLGEGNEELLIGRSYGEVTLPDEAAEAELAIQIASQRLAAHQQSQHRSARRQAHAVLMAALSARRPELRDRVRIVAYRAISLGRRLGVDREQIDDIMLAAELQDVGMLAVPESILEKRIPLNEQESELIRAHPLAGERIISAAPGLAPVARLVRSSYEHFDGSGYPDGLTAETIPLGARIIAVAVAFAAMTSQRAYRETETFESALGELRRDAGSQFDPRVVEALAADLTEEASSALVPIAGQTAPSQGS